MAMQATAALGRARTTFAAAVAQPARPLVFLDIEACGLARGSWPLEIGLAWIDAGRVRSEAHLIAPRPEWDLNLWCGRAASVHGIRLSDVLSARPAEEIAALTDRLAGCEVVSDNPGWDQRWFDLLRGGCRPRVQLTRMREAVRKRLSDRAAAELSLALLHSPTPHRAGPDAARLAQAWADAESAVPACPPVEAVRSVAVPPPSKSVDAACSS